MNIAIRNPVNIPKDISVMWVRQVMNEDDTCDLYISNEQDEGSERCIVALLQDGQLVITNIGGEV